LTFIALLLSVALLAWALSQGIADPPRAGPLQWEEADPQRLALWEQITRPAVPLTPTVTNGVLVVGLPAAAEALSVTLITATTTSDFTLEAALAQNATPIELAYGIVFHWHDAANYSAALINGNGYAEAYELRNGVKQSWFAWAQWPHILYGTDANRLRVDVRGTQVIIRVNDEVVTRAESTLIGGQLGVMFIRPGQTSPVLKAGEISLYWVKFWGK
jgi:hypothetical protein